MIYPTVTVGQPTLPWHYHELVVDEYLVYLDNRLQSVEEELTVDLTVGISYKKLRLDGLPMCGGSVALA